MQFVRGKGKDVENIEDEGEPKVGRQYVLKNFICCPEFIQNGYCHQENIFKGLSGWSGPHALYFIVLETGKSEVKYFLPDGEIPYGCIIQWWNFKSVHTRENEKEEKAHIRE